MRCRNEVRRQSFRQQSSSMAGKREAGLRHADGKQSREEEGQTTRFTCHLISTCELQNQSYCPSEAGTAAGSDPASSAQDQPSLSCEYRCVCALPVDQRVPHAGGDGGGLRRVTESEHALDDRQLRAGRVQAAERAPVVDHHPRRDDLAAPVHRARLNRKPVTKITMRLVPSSSRDGVRAALTTRGTCSSDDSSS